MLNKAQNKEGTAMFQTLLTAQFAIVNTFQYFVDSDTTAGCWAIFFASVALLSLLSKIGKNLSKKALVSSNNFLAPDNIRKIEKAHRRIN